MNFGRVLTVLKKDVRRAPRSGIALLAVLYPALITLIVQVIFGGIFDPKPRVGVIDHGASQFVADMESGPVELTRFQPGQEEQLWKDVERGDLDIGMIYPAGYDDSVREAKPIDMESATSTRANVQALIKLEGIALTTALDLMPNTPVEIEQVTLTDTIAKSWTERLLPIIVLMAFFVAGTFLTGFALIDEKMRGTMRAMLTGPTKVSEVILAKGIFSFGIAFIASGFALWLNGALGTMSWTLALAFGLAAVMTIELGIMVGFAAKDINALYAIIKGMGPLIIITAMPYLWDGWPAWISKIIPFWYVLEPIVLLVNESASFSDVSINFGIAGVLCVALLALAMFIAGRRVRELDALA